jgi:uncharacterized protein with HEPN domain
VTGRDAIVYLDDILVCCRKVREYTREGEAAFLTDGRTQDAVARNFEIIGEAVKNLPPEVRSHAPDIPWRDAAGFRDVLIHAYHEVDIDRMWDSVTEALPAFEQAIQALRDRLASKDSETSEEEE